MCVSPPPPRSVPVTSCCTRRCCSSSSNSLRRSTLSWTSWSRWVPLLCVRAVWCFLQRPHLRLFGTLSSAGAEEDSAGQDGPSAKPWLRPARGGLHPQVSGETQHRHLSHQILCHRGNRKKAASKLKDHKKKTRWLSVWGERTPILTDAATSASWRKASYLRSFIVSFVLVVDARCRYRE